MASSDDASEAASRAGVAIRRLETLEEADGAIAVMRATWGEHQEVPRELLRAFQESGNLLQGAMRDGGIVGFVLGFFGFDEDGIHLHSHMLAVEPGLRSAGIGYALKLAQRDAALDAGVKRIRWTFDPLVARNAYFNLSKLGAVGDAFHRDFYGEMGDLLNRGDRTDRMVVRWDLAAAKVVREPGEAEDAVEVLGRRGVAPYDVRSVSGGPALVRIPRDYPELRSADPDLALRWREAAADAFEACFAAGLRARGFSREGAYLFS